MNHDTFHWVMNTIWRVGVFALGVVTLLGFWSGWKRKEEYYIARSFFLGAGSILALSFVYWFAIFLYDLNIR